MTTAAPQRRCPMCAQPEHGSAACSTVTPAFYGPYFPPLPAITAVPPLRLCPCGRRDEHDHSLSKATLTLDEISAAWNDGPSEGPGSESGRAMRRIADAARDFAIAAYEKTVREELIVMFAENLDPHHIDKMLERAKARLGP